MYSTDSSPTLTNCTFSGNISNTTGGGVLNLNSSPTLTNCIFMANSAVGYGGGMCNINECTPTLTNCTFAANSAKHGRAVACSHASTPSDVELTNCILWDGEDEVWSDDDSIFTITYSDVQGGWPGEGNIDADPLFVTGALGCCQSGGC